MATACNPSKIVAALHEEAEIITDIVRENIKQSDRLALRMVPDGGVVRRHSNQDSVIYGEARQAPVAYNALDHSVKALVSGEMTGRSLQGVNGIYTTDINNIADNACHGQVTIDFAQGFRIRRTVDYGLDLDTPIKCARELDRLGEAHIRGYFKGFQEQFTRFGLDNFSDNLINLMIQQGEANASVLSATQFNVTKGGWSAPPAYRLSIHFLQDYRDHIVATMRGRGVNVPEDWHLEIEAPVNDWIDAVRADQINRMGTGANPGVATGIQTTLNSEWFKDEEGAMKGRRFHIYGGIKCYFNESPIRGYFKLVGTGVYRFVRVLEWINEIGEEGGLVVNANHQYREESIFVDGVKYAMVTLIPHIDPRSFKRFGLIKPLKPIGAANAGVNYEVRVIEGAKLACNDFDDKFKLAARHEFRFKAEYPEFSGYIAYLHGRRTGYVISVSGRVYGSESDTAAAGPEQYVTGAPDDCSVAECAQCDKVVGEGGQCVEDGVYASPLDTIGLTPAGAKTVGYFGGADDAEVLKIAVERLGGSQGVATVDYTITTPTGAAANNVAATTLTWENGDTAPKFISIPLQNEAVDADTIVVTLTNVTGATLRTGADVFTGTIDKL